MARVAIGAQFRRVMGSETLAPRPFLGHPRLAFALALGLGLGFTLAPAAARADLPGALAALAAVGPEGAGNAEATRAWAELAAAPAAELPRLVTAMDGLGDRARNYLFAAATSLADRELKAGHPLPVTALGELLLDTHRGARGRRLAYELIARADPPTAEALLAGLVDDPAPELRRDAVQRLIDRAAKTLAEGRKESATVLFQQSLAFSRDGEQIESLTKSLKDLGHPVDLVQLLGFLTRWQVIGPFDNTGRAGFAKVFPPETELRLDAEYDGKDGKVRWKEFTTKHEAGMVDFNQAYAPLKEVTGYAFTEFQSDGARPAELRLGCKNGWKIWFNGQFLFGRDEYHRGAELDQYRLPVDLKAGRNTILVKLTQDEEKEEWTVEWEFQLRVTDPTGRVIRPAPPEAKVASR